jgi:hypothetical protein
MMPLPLMPRKVSPKSAIYAITGWIKGFILRVRIMSASLIVSTSEPESDLNYFRELFDGLNKAGLGNFVVIKKTERSDSLTLGTLRPPSEQGGRRVHIRHFRHFLVTYTGLSFMQEFVR